MTYQEFIAQVNREVRDNAWPDPSSSVTQEQIDISYAAVLAVMIDLPIYELTKKEDTLAGTSATAYNGYLSYGMPTDIFAGREDLGIYYHVFDGVQYDPSQAIPINSLRLNAANTFQSDNIGLFAFDRNGRSLDLLNTDTTKDITLVHVGEPTKPTTGNYTSTVVPAPTSAHQRLVNLVAAHIAGSRLRDGAGAQFQSILSNMYNTNSKPVEA